MDLRPELQACSDVLWMLRRLLPHRRHGRSWVSGGSVSVRSRSRGTCDRHPPAGLIELGYEGVSIEQVLEQRLRRDAYGPQATTATVLARSRTRRCTCAAGVSPTNSAPIALKVLATERSVDGAPEVPRRVRALLAYYRTSEPVLPSFVGRGVRQDRIRALLHAAADGVPGRGGDRRAGRGDARLPVQHGEPRAVAGLRPYAAGAGGRPVAPRRSVQDGLAAVRRGCSSAPCRGPSCGLGARRAATTSLVVPAHPRYLSGFVTAGARAGLADVVVKRVSNAFGRLPDAVLLPWLPLLINRPCGPVPWELARC